MAGHHHSFGLDVGWNFTVAQHVHFCSLSITIFEIVYIIKNKVNNKLIIY